MVKSDDKKEPMSDPVTRSPVTQSPMTQSVMIQSPTIQRTDVTTGDLDKRMHLYYQLINSMRTAEQIDIIVSFLMESGVRLLLSSLKDALEKGTRVRILTGNYLGITEPSALYLIKQALGERVDLRFYKEQGRSFHPKSYIFHYASHSEIFIGSSNISRSALTSGIEWNYRFSSRVDPVNYEKFYRTFEDLFLNHSVIIDDERLREYSKSWHRPAAARDLDRYDSFDYPREPEEGDGNSTFETQDKKVHYQPRGAQIEALYCLNLMRREGCNKALVLAATGVGKTVLAAFDSLPYDTILFIAHREEILRQAAATFGSVRNTRDYGFFDGKEKCTDKPLIFASVSTLGNQRYLNPSFFSQDYFSYVIIDETHHGVTDQYRHILDYFHPRFLLGLTATPERMDGRSIYELFDYNVAYEIPLQEAINKGMLVPFHHYGIYDDTLDYSAFRPVRGRYAEEDLNKGYVGNKKRGELILRHYHKYGSQRALGFCCSRLHAEDMARVFSESGIPSVAVYSGEGGTYQRDRSEAIELLTKGQIRVLFSVDMFNEGVDITSIDMVMFLRPTESPVVFLQQLGRGLRRNPGKAYLTVLDFIGNYEKAGNVRFFLLGKKAEEQAGSKREKGANQEELPGDGAHFTSDNGLPDDCFVDFDLELIDLFRVLDRKREKLRDLLRIEYHRIKELLGRRPMRLDFFTYLDEGIYQLALGKAKENPFKHYLDFLKGLGELTPEEAALEGTPAWEFLSLIENTNMSKVYKMPVLMAFYDQDQEALRLEISEEQVLKAWKDFFRQGSNWRDLDSKLTYSSFQEISDKQHLSKICQMPVNFLLKSGQGFFVQKEGSCLCLKEELRSFTKNVTFLKHYKDIIDYRAMDYYQRRYHNRNEQSVRE